MDHSDSVQKLQSDIEKTLNSTNLNAEIVEIRESTPYQRSSFKMKNLPTAKYEVLQQKDDSTGKKDQITSLVKSSSKKSSHYELISYSQLPKWAQDNEFITKYYRKTNTNWKHVILSSFFQFHNESFNIYSHAIPALVALIVANHFIFMPTSTFADEFLEKIVWISYLVCATIMLTCSWTFHACYIHSYKTFCLGSKLDYAGISFMIVGSFLPWLFYTFYCEKVLFRVYFTSITILGVICIFTSLSKKFAQPEYRSMRASLFCGMGLFAVIPVIHMGIKIGFTKLFVDYYLWTLLIMASCYIGGAVIFSLRVPERFYPGKFDRFLNSHNIFHTLIVIAASIHFIGVWWLKEDRFGLGNQCKH